MADEKITALTALTAPVSGDLLAIVDVSDTTMAATGTDKKMTIANLFLNIPAQIVGIGDTTNAKMTVGLTINQGANDNEILALKSSDVGHGYTSFAEADTFCSFRKFQDNSGGFILSGFKDADGVNYGAFGLAGYLAEDVDTTKSAAGRGLNELHGAQISGDALANVVADGNVFVYRTYKGAAWATIAIIDEDGELHTDDIIGVGDDWDEWDDLALASDLSRLPKGKFSEMMRYKAEDFERAGLVTLSTDKLGQRHAFIKHAAFLRFYACCFAEAHNRLEALDAEIRVLRQRLNVLETPCLIPSTL